MWNTVESKDAAMTKGLNPAGALLPAISSPEASGDATADALIADYGGDARAAIVALLKVVHGLMRENKALLRPSSSGFVDQSPEGF
jgi:hypothetical protein